MAEELSESEELDVTDRIKSICKALGRYYKSRDCEYNRNFSRFCDDEGIDDDAIDEDYAQNNLLELIIIDFAKGDEDNLDNFPFGSNTPSSEEEKAAFILNLIKQCDADPNIVFYPEGDIC